MMGHRRMIAVQPSGLLIPLNRLISKFTGGDEVALRCGTSGTDTTWTLFQHVGSRLYWRCNFHTANPAVGQERMNQYGMWLSEYYRGYTQNSTPALTKNGFTLYSAGNYLGGGYHRSTITGEYLQLVTGSGCSYIAGACAPSFPGWLFIVTIDGDNTRADLLPTAQDLVNAGTVAATALVANGGNLNPTDRIWDTYNLTSNTGTGNLSGHIDIFTRSLTAGIHTVRVTVTGQKNVAAGAQFNGICLLMAGGPGYAGATGIGTATSVWYDIQSLSFGAVLNDVGSPQVEDVSWSFQPTGATAKEWCGHSGSLKTRTAPTITVDGVAVVPVHATTYPGSEIILRTFNNILHTETGIVSQGTWDAAYTLNKSNGLTISHTTSWGNTGVATSYPCMMDTLHASFDRYTCLGVVGSGDLVLNDDSANYNTSDQAGYAWKNGGYIAKMMQIPVLALTVDNWADAPTNRLWWADVSANAGAWKKLYATRFQADKAYTASTVWQSQANYRLAYFLAGVGTTFPI